MSDYANMAGNVPHEIKNSLNTGDVFILNLILQ